MIRRDARGRAARARALVVAVLCVSLASLLSIPAAAQPQSQGQGPAIDADQLPADLQEVGLEQRLDESVPLDLEFTDHNGNKVRIGDYLEAGKPVLLKRGPAATLEELLGAADYVLAEGNPDVVLCERGIRGFDPGVRYTLDLSIVPRLRARSPLPILVDPSHGTGRRDLVLPMARAALAAGGQVPLN